MMNKIFRLYILFALFFTVGIFAFADGSRAALAGKPSMDTAAVYKQVEENYGQAVKLYKNKKLAKAKKKFNEVSAAVPDYKSTRYYLRKINDKIKEAQIKGLYRQALAGAEDIYMQALHLYRDHRWAEAKAKFETVEGMVPDLNYTRRYLQKIGSFIAGPVQVKPVNGRQQESGALELKHKEEFLRQQVQKDEERIKQEAIIRREAQRRQGSELQERQRLAQLEARRKAVRKQLENGVEVMYQEALSLYKKGDYPAAADKFKDVQDILPGYKRAGQYMDEARLKSLTVNPPSASVSHQVSVSKALDLFDSNAK